MERFPIQDRRRNYPHGDTATLVTSVPWAVVEALRDQCQRVHDQSIERLAHRGGLTLGELWAHVHDDWDTSHTLDELRAWARSIGGLP
jgi:hypothetical protein